MGIHLKSKLVGGLIEVVAYKDTLLIYNEEGKILNMDANFAYDYTARDCFAVGDDYKNGNFKSLTDEQIQEFTKNFIRKSIKKKRDINKHNYHSNKDMKSR